MTRFPSFSWLNNILLYVYNTFSLFIHPLTDYLDCFHILALVNNVAVYIGVKISLQHNEFIPYIPRSRIAGSYGTSIFNLFRKLPTVFHNGCTNLHFHQQCTRVPFLHIVTDSYLFVFLIIAILTGVKWHLIMALIYIFLMIRDIVSFHIAVGHLYSFF